MSTIDQKVVEMRFENGQFEKGVNQSISSLDKLKQSLAFDNSTTKQTQGILASLGDGVDNLVSRFSVVGEAIHNIGMQIVNTMIEIGNSFGIEQVYEGWNKYETILRSTQTIMAATRKEWDNEADQMEYVSGVINKLRWFTDETSYSLTDMTNNIGKFTSAGIDLDVATTAMMGISNWAAISGAGINEASRAMYNLAQAVSMGGVYAKDWVSIENANMATKEFKETAIATGIALGTLKKNTDGTIETLNGVQVTVENFRSTLNNDAGAWFNSDVLLATLDQYGQFANELQSATEKTGMYATQLLQSVGIYKDYNKQLASYSEKTGISIQQLRQYVSEWVEGTLDIEATAKKHGLAASSMSSAITSLGISMTEIRGIAEEEGVAMDVLVPILDHLSQKHLDLGYNAFKAGQESRTLTDALVYAKDAISSQWFRTFELLIGGLLNAKGVFTQVSEELYDLFVADLENRNAILEEWAEMGGRTALLEGIANVWHNIKVVIQAIKDAWKDIFPPKTAEQLVEATENFNKLTKKMKLTDEQAQSLRQTFGYLFNVLKNIGTNLKKIFNAIKDAFTEMFPPKTTDETLAGFNNLAKGLSDLSDKMVISDASADKLKRTFKGIIAIADIVAQLIGAIAKRLFNLSPQFDTTSFSILDATAALGDWLVEMDQMIKEQGLMDVFIDNVINFFASIPEYVDNAAVALTGMHLDEIFDKIAESVRKAWEALVAFFGFSDDPDAYTYVNLFQDMYNGLDKFVQSLTGMSLEEIWSKVTEAVTIAWEAIKNFFGVGGDPDAYTFMDLIDDIKNIFEKLGKWIDDAREAVTEFVESLGFEWPSGEEFVANVKKLATVGAIATALYAIYKLWKKVKGKINDSTIIGPIQSVASGIKGVTDELQTNLKIKTILAYAKVILELAAALVVLSLLPTGKVLVAAGAMVLMMGMLNLYLSKLRDMDIPKDQLTALSGLTAAIGLVIAAFGASVYAIGNLPFDQLIASGAIMEIFMGILIGFMYTIDSIDVPKDKATNLAIVLAFLSVAILSFGTAIAIATASGAGWEEIAAAGATLAGMLMAVALAFKIMPTNDEMVQQAAAMAIVGGALALMGAGLMMATMSGDWVAIAVAGTIMAAMLFAIAAALKILEDSNVLAGAAAILIVSAALLVMSASLAVVAALPWDSLLLGVGALVVLLAALTVALAVLGGMSAMIIAGAAALLVASLALTGLAVCLALIGQLDPEQLITALVGLAAALVIVIAAGYAATFASVGLLALGAAVALIGVGALAAGAGCLLFAQGLQTIVDFGPEGAQRIVDAFLVFFNALPEILGALVEGVAAFCQKFLENKDIIQAGIVGLVETIGEAIVAFLPYLSEMILSFLGTILDSIILMTEKLLEWVKVVISGILDILIETVPKIIELVVVSIAAMLDGIITLVPKFVEAGWAIIIGFLTGIRDHIGEAVTLAFEILEEFITALAENIPKLADTGMQALVTFLNGFADAIDNNAEKIHDAMVKIGESLINAFKTILGIHSPSKEMDEIGQQTMQGLVNGVDSKSGELEETVNNMTDGMEEIIRKQFDKFKKLGEDLMTSINDGIKKGGNGSKDAMKKALDGVGDKVKDQSKAFTELGDKLVQYAADGVSKNSSKLVDAIKDAIKKAVNAGKGYYDSMYDMGKYIAEGAGKGIKAACSYIVDANKYIVYRAVYEAKKLLGIASPSKVYAEMGMFMDKGMAQGMVNYANVVAYASASVGQTAIDSMQEAISGVSDIIESDIDSDPVIRPVLDLSNVADGINQMDGMFAADRSVNLANASGLEINNQLAEQERLSIMFEDLKNTISGLMDNKDTGNTYNNTFNIKSTNPKEAADEISFILQQKVERRDAVWE